MKLIEQIEQRSEEKKGEAKRRERNGMKEREGCLNGLVSKTYIKSADDYKIEVVNVEMEVTVK